MQTQPFARFVSLASAAALLSLAGCSFAIKAPTQNATVDAPTEVRAEWSNNVGSVRLFFDAQEITQQVGTGSSPAQGMLFCPAAGAHTLSARGQAPWNYTVTDSSTFTVGNCPLCFPCGAGDQQDPLTCRCCQGASCDAALSANFGPSRYNQPDCGTPSAKASNCINQNCLGICGNSPNGGSCGGTWSGPEAAAVAFSHAGPGTVRLTRLLLVLSHQRGANAYQVVIAADGGGQPGTVLEAIALASIRPFDATRMTTPIMVASSVQPVLQPNARYWLVVAPGASDTVGCWNFSGGDFSAPFSANTTPGTLGVPSPGGPWAIQPTGGYNLRPAFEVHAR